MSKSLESFVRGLKEDGIDAGMKAGEELLSQTRKEADQIIEDARQAARAIVNEAHLEAEHLAAQQEHELQQAARDLLLWLKGKITDLGVAVIEKQAIRAFDDDEFMTGLIHDVATEYARQDAKENKIIIVHVNGQRAKDAATRALDKVGQERFKIVDDLNGYGFEYQVAEATVEVSSDAVAELLRPYVSEQLERRLVEATIPKKENK